MWQFVLHDRNSKFLFYEWNKSYALHIEFSSSLLDRIYLGLNYLHVPRNPGHLLPFSFSADPALTCGCTRFQTAFFARSLLEHSAPRKKQPPPSCDASSTLGPILVAVLQSSLPVNSCKRQWRNCRPLEYHFVMNSIQYIICRRWRSLPRTYFNCSCYQRLKYMLTLVRHRLK